MKIQCRTKLSRLAEIVQMFHAQFVREAEKRKVRLEDLEMLVTVESPFRPRTTGAGSQNRMLNGIIQQICMETGQDFHSTKEYIKSKAVEMGYPMLERKCAHGLEPVLDWYGNPRGISEADSSVEQCSLLIESAIQLATELGIVLKIGG